jgi:hypothetical protein
LQLFFGLVFTALGIFPRLAQYGAFASVELPTVFSSARRFLKKSSRSRWDLVAARSATG